MRSNVRPVAGTLPNSSVRGIYIAGSTAARGANSRRCRATLVPDSAPEPEPDAGVLQELTGIAAAVRLRPCVEQLERVVARRAAKGVDDVRHLTGVDRPVELVLGEVGAERRGHPRPEVLAFDPEAAVGERDRLEQARAVVVAAMPDHEPAFIGHRWIVSTLQGLSMVWAMGRT